MIQMKKREQTFISIDNCKEISPYNVTRGHEVLVRLGTCLACLECISLDQGRLWGIEEGIYIVGNYTCVSLPNSILANQKDFEYICYFVTCNLSSFLQLSTNSLA